MQARERSLIRYTVPITSSGPGRVLRAPVRPRPLTASEVRPVSHPARSAPERPDYDGHFVMIPLTHGKFAIVDEADAGPVSDIQWYAIKCRNTWYALRSVPSSEGTGMHVLVADCKGIDHANGNGLDNRRVNLRPATRSQNGANRPPPSNNTSGYKGVYWSRPTRKWRAVIRVNDRKANLGYFTDPVDAARAYNAAALEAWGEFAWLNPV